MDKHHSLDKRRYERGEVMYLLEIDSEEDVATYHFKDNEFNELLDLIRVTQARSIYVSDYQIHFYRDDE